MLRTSKPIFRCPTRSHSKPRPVSYAITTSSAAISDLRRTSGSRSSRTAPICSSTERVLGSTRAVATWRTGLCLVRALEEVGCGGGVLWFKVLRCGRVGGQIEQGISRNYREALFGARHFFPYGHQLTQKRLRLALRILPAHSHFKEVQLVRCF